MRISDWSSDVCSSDLRFAVMDINLHLRCADQAQQSKAADDARLDGDRQRRFARCARAGRRIEHRPEIGGASCRERVCQYVEISVSSVSFKKNKTSRERR